MNRKSKLFVKTKNMNSGQDSNERGVSSADSILDGIELARTNHGTINHGTIGNVQFSDLSSNNNVGNKVRVENKYQHQPQPDPSTDAGDNVNNERTDVLNRSSEENRSVLELNAIVDLNTLFPRPLTHKIAVAIIVVMIATINIVWLVKYLLEHLF